MSKELNFLDKFSQPFEMFSYGNQTYGRLCAHVILGQILKNIKIPFGPIYIDPRISVFFIQPSGTGKSVAWEFVQKVAEKAQLRIEEVSEATDAALVGTIETEEVQDLETKTKVISHNVVKGSLANSDILHYDEGYMLLKASQYSQNALTWFQIVLNPIGQNRCSKHLAHGDIDFFPTCSLIVTSHELEEAIDVILKKGFFQRIVFFPRYVPILDRMLWEFLRAERLGQRFDSVNIDIENLGEKLMTIRTKYTKDFIFKIDESIKPAIKAKINEFYKLVNSAHERVREIMATFCPRYDNIMYILAFHHACAEMKDIVDMEDINYGFDLAFRLFKEVMTWVEENIPLLKLTSKEISYLSSAYAIYQGFEKTPEGFVMYYAFSTECGKRWRISLPTVNRYLEKFKNYGKLKEMEKNNVKWVKIVT